MQVHEHILPLPEDTLRLERIEIRKETLGILTGLTAAAAVFWALIFSGLVWTVVDFDYSWSPLKWLAPIGVVIASSGVMIGWSKRKLHREKKEIRDRTRTFVLNRRTLNDLKPELHELANKGLAYCDTRDQTFDVLVAHRDAALALAHLDASAVDTTQDGDLKKFEELREDLRRIRDEVIAAHQRKML